MNPDLAAWIKKGEAKDLKQERRRAKRTLSLRAALRRLIGAVIAMNANTHERGAEFEAALAEAEAIVAKHGYELIVSDAVKRQARGEAHGA